MKTKQNMVVLIGNHNIQAQHGSEMINLNDILEAGNTYRIKAGLRPYDSVRDVLRKQDIAGYVMFTEQKLRERVMKGDYSTTPKMTQRIFDDSNLGITPTLELDKYGRPKFPKNMLAVKKRSGRYGGTWVHVKVAIRVGVEIHYVFADQVIDMFIENQLFKRRDDGGEAWKELTTDVKDYLNPDPRKDYAKLGAFIKRVVFYGEPHAYVKMNNIWNTSMATPEHLSRRKDICVKLKFAIRMGLVETMGDLYRVVRKMEKIEKRV